MSDAHVAGGLVSVVMPVWNGAPHLDEAIESILRQNYRHLELIVVDDGSTDNSPDIIERRAASDSRVRPLFRGHEGTGRAANAGVDLALGRWIARMDHDDVALPHRLATQLAWMAETGADVCGSGAVAFGQRDELFWFPQSHEAILVELLFRSPLLGPTVVMRADILKAHRYDEHATLDDYELWTRLSPHVRMGNVPDVLLRYRCHQRQDTTVRRRQTGQDLQKYRFRHFYGMFPGTPLEEYLPLARVSDRLPLTSLADLDRAGRWLVELARSQDERLRRRMARRWRETWERSTALGPEGRRLYEAHAAHLPDEEQPGPGSTLRTGRKETREARTYALCGVRLRTECALPADGVDAQQVDIVLHDDGFVPPDHSEPLPVRRERIWRRDEAGWQLRYRNATGEVLEYRFSRDGSTINVRCTRLDEDKTSVTLGPALAAALHLRGTTLLHATAVAVDGRAVLLAAVASTGKSTLSTALVDAGCPLLTDDLVALSLDDRGVEVQPGHPRLEIYPETRRVVRMPGAEWPRVFVTTQADDKRWIDPRSLPGGFAASPAPLGAIYVLRARRPDLDAPEIVPIAPSEACLRLIGHFYGTRWLSIPLDVRLECSARIAARVPVRSLALPDDLDRVPAAAQALIADARRTIARGMHT